MGQEKNKQKSKNKTQNSKISPKILFDFSLTAIYYDII